MPYGSVYIHTYIIVRSEGSTAHTHILWEQPRLLRHLWWRRPHQRSPPLSSSTVSYAEGEYTPPRAEGPAGRTLHTPSLHPTDLHPHTQPVQDKREDVTGMNMQNPYKVKLQVSLCVEHNDNEVEQSCVSWTVCLQKCLFFVHPWLCFICISVTRR